MSPVQYNSVQRHGNECKLCGAVYVWAEVSNETLTGSCNIEQREVQAVGAEGLTARRLGCHAGNRGENEKHEPGSRLGCETQEGGPGQTRPFWACHGVGGEAVEAGTST